MISFTTYKQPCEYYLKHHGESPFWVTRYTPYAIQINSVAEIRIEWGCNHNGAITRDFQDTTTI